MTSTDHPAIAKFVTALHEAGLADAADRIRILDNEVRTAAAAAQALGVPVGAIANSLVFRCGDGAPLLALTSGAHRADIRRIARLAGVDQVAMADPVFVREHTGQPIGGVAPAGHPSRLRTLVDNHLAGHPVIWAAAGHPKSVFPITFDQLVTLSRGTAVDLGLEEDDS